MAFKMMQRKDITTEHKKVLKGKKKSSYETKSFKMVERYTL